MANLTVTQVLRLGELGTKVLREFCSSIVKYHLSKHGGLVDTVRKELTWIGTAYAIVKPDQDHQLPAEQQQGMLSRVDILNAIINLNLLARQLPELQARITVIIGYLKK